MLKRSTLLIPALTALASLGIVGDAHAICDTLVLGNADQIVIVGEYTTLTCTNPNNLSTCTAHRTGNGAACIIEPDGSEWLEVFACDDEDVVGDQVEIRTGSGDDQLGVLLSAHTVGQPGLVTIQGGGLARHCGDVGVDLEALAPFPATFKFGVAAYMGDGEDRFVGSPNSDWAVSSWYDNGSFKADGDLDIICGMNGNDYLHGDLDDNGPAGSEEMISGGNGTDYCDGDPGFAFDGGDASDLYSSCETHYDAGLSGLPTELCTNNTNPLLW
ncbi:MAG TPA: hypothetical protein VG755_31100 [Nannocystaceae bacterium]|nr:hypothetical protein [Nannocystaceae bacterium]